jgi:phytoene desaturase
MADAVVCTLDLPTAYQQILDDLPPPRAARRGQYSPSAVVWHVGVHRQPAPPIAHHNIHFADDWSASFDALQQGRLMPDPSRLVTIPSLDDPTLAPTGCSTLYVLEPAPNLNGTISWSTEAKPLRDRMHTFLAQQRYPTDVITEELVTPLDWQTQGMAAGTPSRLPTPSDRPDRSVRRTSSGGCLECSSPDPGRFPESAFPWCSSRASSRPTESPRTFRSQPSERLDFL